MFRLALVELMLSVVIFAGGLWCYRDTPDYCPYYSAVWTSAIYIINSLVSQDYSVFLFTGAGDRISLITGPGMASSSSPFPLDSS